MASFFAHAASDCVRSILSAGERSGRRGEVLGHPISKDSRIIGASPGHDTPADLPKLHKAVLDLAKAKQEGTMPESLAKGFAAFVDRHATNLSWEALPSTSLPEFDFVNHADAATKLRYTNEIQHAIGTKILDAFGIPRT